MSWIAISPALLLLLILLALVLVLRARKRREGQRAKPAPRTAFDEWVEDQVAHEVGKKNGLGHGPVLEALRGHPEPETVSSVERAVRSVQLGFEKLSFADEVEVRVEIAFEDGTSASRSKRLRRDELPEGVRADLESSAAARVYRPWYFPWSNPDRVYMA